MTREEFTQKGLDYYDDPTTVIDYITALEAQIQATKSCTNCQSYNAQGEYSKCHLHIYTTLSCLENNFSVWRQR